MRKYKCALTLAVMLAYLLAGCTKADGSSPSEKQADFTLEVTSTIAAEYCYICGDGNDTPMPFYEKADSVGIIYWNDPTIADTKVRVFEPDGTERFHTGVMMMSGIMSAEHGNAAVYALPDNGRSEITIQYHEGDEINFETVRDILCQDCLDKVVAQYVDHRNHFDGSTIGATGFSLVDFQTKEIYSLSGPTVGYGIRDYHVRFFTEETLDEKNNITTDGKVTVLITYSPIREPD